MWASEWQQYQTVYALSDEGSLLDPGGASLGIREQGLQRRHGWTSFCSRWYCDLEKVSTMTTIVISAHCVRGACGGRYFFGFSRRLRDWVGSHYCCPRGRNVDLHFLSCLIGGGNVPSWVQPRCVPCEFYRSCCMCQTRRHQRV